MHLIPPSPLLPPHPSPLIPSRPKLPLDTDHRPAKHCAPNRTQRAAGGSVSNSNSSLWPRSWSWSRSWSWEASMGLRMQCLSLAIRVPDICITYHQNLIAYRTSTRDFYIQWMASVVYRLLSFQSELLPLFDLKTKEEEKKTVSGVTGTIQTSLPVICARMCMTVPTPSPPMVVVYGIARTTVIRSVIEAVFLYHAWTMLA